MNKYWISWYQPGEDCRPLTYPPNASILGWWESGECNGGSTLCALALAESKDAAKEAVQKDWPEAEDWRFCDLKEPEFLPGSRFTLDDWMKDRIFQKDSAIDE
jgi:hypothetical protein